ncbi:MAG: alginate export family protein [bacterium]|nr:alginate export family protein [bacterium]
MKHYFNQFTKLNCLVLALLCSFGLKAQEADNVFNLDAQLMTRGELRAGGFKADSLDSERVSHFALGRYRIIADYQRSWLNVRLTPQYTGIWGQGIAGVVLYEGWAKMQSKKGLFVKIGRQELTYDDGRIIGNDDWTMTAPTHDVLKLGYDGESHKVHLLAAYNQNAENIDNGVIYYSGGLQPYKTMQTLWYHYDTPKKSFGISLLGMNIGMQNTDQEHPITYYQQLVGTYMSFRPKHWSLEEAFYYQMGKEEHGMNIDAFMASAKLNVKPSVNYILFAGYDYLSGDKYFNVPPDGGIGLVFHDKARGFNAIFGSHHEFYGAMDFFYLSNYVGGFTPGLQNLYFGVNIKPVSGLSINAAYHYYAIATDLDYVNTKTLGHSVELASSYAFNKAVSVSAGYTFMKGSETMELLNKVSEKRQLHWAWLMMTITPKLFTSTWQDKN